MTKKEQQYAMYVCKDGTVTYSRSGPFNGVALPVHWVDTEAEARAIQVALCRLQYNSHPDLPGQPWYVLSDWSGKVDDLPRVTEKMHELSIRWHGGIGDKVKQNDDR